MVPIGIGNSYSYLKLYIDANYKKKKNYNFEYFIRQFKKLCFSMYS